jgi:hypothetical protein
MPVQLSSGNSGNPCLKVCGILKGDTSFAEWNGRFWAEKQQGIDDAVLSVEESLLVM